MNKVLAVFVTLFLAVSTVDARWGQGFGGMWQQDKPNIGYLKWNSDDYTDPENVGINPTFKIVDNTVTWDIYVNAGSRSETKRSATALVEHINFMKNKVESGRVVRSWDKLFVIEASMHPYIDLQVEYPSVDYSRIKITKTADNACALEIIKTHANAVSTDFFSGNINKNYSAYADSIMAMDVCYDYLDQMNSYIDKYWNIN
jgi:hypothetical protein